MKLTYVARAVMLMGVANAGLALADEPADTNLEKITVTGSFIKRADIETPSPVQVITAADLKESGYTSISDVLNHLTANGQGTLSQGFNRAFAGGASGVSLRGLTVGATLVLIDGHRMAPYPLSDDGQRPFVDISNIPLTRSSASTSSRTAPRRPMVRMPSPVWSTLS